MEWLGEGHYYSYSTYARRGFQVCALISPVSPPLRSSPRAQQVEMAGWRRAEVYCEVGQRSGFGFRGAEPAADE